MSFFKKISQALGGGRPAGGDFYELGVKCENCGELITARVNLMNDLSIRYGEQGEADTFFCRKTIIGKNKRCFRRIEVELTFDKDRNLLDRQIQGGTFTDET